MGYKGLASLLGWLAVSMGFFCVSLSAADLPVENSTRQSPLLCARLLANSQPVKNVLPKREDRYVLERSIERLRKDPQASIFEYEVKIWDLLFQANPNEAAAIVADTGMNLPEFQRRLNESRPKPSSPQERRREWFSVAAVVAVLVGLQTYDQYHVATPQRANATMVELREHQVLSEKNEELLKFLTGLRSGLFPPEEIRLGKPELVGNLISAEGEMTEGEYRLVYAFPQGKTFTRLYVEARFDGFQSVKSKFEFRTLMSAGLNFELNAVSVKK